MGHQNGSVCLFLQAAVYTAHCFTPQREIAPESHMTLIYFSFAKQAVPPKEAKGNLNDLGLIFS